jgi:hypothetical protein
VYIKEIKGQYSTNDKDTLMYSDIEKEYVSNKIMEERCCK